ncbi:MAG: 2Fe-2S iron-sulfur cluster-binding protein, partial [Gemmatimonadota bacterium]|nr:2Fe-2S iron-sulfur cluster-binding protein [Gemmatimonadota bacterium]
ETDTITLTIDGQEVTVPKGTSLLHAAEAMGTLVPHYCYHPGLSAPAQCRLCLVEVEGAPKLQPSCVTMAQEGQVVHTDSESARAMRRGVLEFYLVNHPLDCPICDMSGECKLQDYVYQEGREHGRGREPKRVFGRDDFGGDILYYGDRCVMCTRCVRFMDEVAGEGSLTVVERGSRAVIDTFFDRGLEDSKFAGNVVDICPVGALVSKDFLHKARAWDLDHTPSVCPNCSHGCNIELHTRDNLVQRFKPRENLEVNGHWMCDYGRMNYEWINREDRYDAPHVRTDAGHARKVGWGEALAAIAEELQSLGSSTVEVVGSPFWSLEGLGALVDLARAAGAGWRGTYRSRRAEDEMPLPGFPTLVRRKDLAPNVDGAALLGLSRVGGDDGRGGLEEVAAHDGILIVMGDDLADQPDSFGSRARLFVYAGASRSKAAKNAHFVLPITTFAEQEGTFLNAQGRVQRFWQGLQAPLGARPAWLVLGALAVALEGRGEAAPQTAAQAFARVARDTDALSGMTYETLGTAGAQVAEGAPA